ncbi:hypothetical protein MA16_Dca005601 [Dendrobium catenatum]|uniref:Uncharacterized protein n=1 Tax=Dendrobium catenatum TaxID=906689 RepID=A0A2I0WQ25_9ASPA|nr:hypothetical protein MA16_Dca005601 [Dendrobium catenatum]
MYFTDNPSSNPIPRRSLTLNGNFVNVIFFDIFNSIFFFDVALRLSLRASLSPFVSSDSTKMTLLSVEPSTAAVTKVLVNLLIDVTIGFSNGAPSCVPLSTSNSESISTDTEPSCSPFIDSSSWPV